MSEQEWRSWADPVAMLDFLADRAGIPLFRRFALECCRRIEHLIRPYEGGRYALQVLQTMAEEDVEDGEVSDAVETARTVAIWAARAAGASGPTARGCALVAVYSATVGKDRLAALDAAWALVRQTGLDRGRVAQERRAQADLLRSLCHPFVVHQNHC